LRPYAVRTRALLARANVNGRLTEAWQAFWGSGFSWRDPEGNVWDVAWAKGTTFDERGGVSFP